MGLGVVKILTFLDINYPIVIYNKIIFIYFSFLLVITIKVYIIFKTLSYFSLTMFTFIYEY